MAHLVKGFNGGHVQALLPGTFRIRPLKAEWEYGEIFDMATECLEAFNPLPDNYVMDNLERMDLYRRLTTRFVMPELINVVDREGIWRVPYCAEGRGAKTCITEAIASLLTEVSAGRYRLYGIGDFRSEGDLFLKGPLLEFEYETLVHGQFPPNMRRFGRPGPGLCEAPEQALVFQSPSVHQPGAPRGSGQGYDGHGIDYNAPPPFQNQPPPNHFGASPQLGGSRQPRGSRRGGGQFVHGPRAPPKFAMPVTGSGSESDNSSTQDSDSPPPSPKAKAKKKKGKAEKKPARRQRSPSEDSVAGGVEDLAISDEEPVGRRPPKHAPKKATRRVGRSDDEDEPPSQRAPQRSTSQGPPRRGPLATTEIRSFAPTNGEPQQKQPSASAASKPGRRVGRSDDEAEYSLPPRGQRSAAPGPVAPGQPARTLGRADARRRERRQQAVLEDEKPPELDPAEKARLDALKAANGF
ncbi:MAG: hypothetical protein LQ346_000760 [Caloplaca aetnensis]|nr:MAG: hypothetical protein LQ346_000760 [Caloplaca aetnensis]